MTRTHRVRLGLVAVGTLLVMLVTIQPIHSSGPPGGFRGGPPIGPPPMPGPPGFGGGFGGRPPGFPEPPRPPDFPRPPEFPRPPIGPGPGFGGGGIGPGGPNMYTWRCGRCGHVMGSGPTPPATAVCPVCRTENLFPPGGGGPVMPGPIGPPPGITPPNPRIPGPDFGNGPPPPIAPLPGGPDIDVPRFNNAPPAPAGGVYVPSSDSTSSSPSRRKAINLVLITLGVLVLLGAGIGGVVFALIKNNQSNKSRARRAVRRRRRWDDDDD